MSSVSLSLHFSFVGGGDENWLQFPIWIFLRKPPSFLHFPFFPGVLISSGHNEVTNDSKLGPRRSRIESQERDANVIVMTTLIATSAQGAASFRLVRGGRGESERGAGNFLPLLRFLILSTVHWPLNIFFPRCAGGPEGAQRRKALKPSSLVDNHRRQNAGLPSVRFHSVNQTRRLSMPFYMKNCGCATRNLFAQYESKASCQNSSWHVRRTRSSIC